MVDRAPRPHLAHWPRRLPTTLEVPETSLWFNLEVAARRYPDKPAYVFFGSALSYRELHEQALALAGVQWSRQIMQDDARGGSIDHLGEPWAYPLPRTPLENGSIEGGIEDYHIPFVHQQMGPGGKFAGTWGEDCFVGCACRRTRSTGSPRSAASCRSTRSARRASAHPSAAGSRSSSIRLRAGTEPLEIGARRISLS